MSKLSQPPVVVLRKEMKKISDEYLDDLEDFLEDIDSSKNKYCTIYKKSNEYIVYINNDIAGLQHYTKLLYLLREADPHEVVHIHICSFGGDMDTALSLKQAIETSEAKVIGYTQVQCMSAATVIYLACHYYVVGPYVEFMVHQPAWGNGVMKQHEHESAITHSSPYLRQVYKDIYGSFLTPSEMNQVINGKDLYFNAKKLITKLKKHQKKKKAFEMVAIT